MRPPTHVVVIGAGPCGLAVGRELKRFGHDSWAIYERNSFPGGHASSVVDPQGYTWDLGGHVVFSHFGEFDALLDEVMGDDVYEHERSSYVRFDGRWIPYPFQNNLGYLDPEVAYECLIGLADADGGTPSMDFATWMEATFGPGITRRFMRPYNLKVWATPPEEMSSTWIAERVSVVDFERALRNVVLQRDDVGWGPNNTFRFPRTGGTGEIYRRVAATLSGHVFYSRELVEVDATAKTVQFTDGTRDAYDVLVSTMPLDLLVGAIRNCPTEIRVAAAALRHTGVLMVGVGYEQPVSDDKSWMYFPDDTTPFYRATNFAKYSPANVPGGDAGRLSSYLTETSYSDHRPRPGAEIEERVPRALAESGTVRGDPTIASIHSVDIDFAYPVPTLDRDRALAVIQPWLRDRDIYSRGRFGSWRYEIGNMDHAVKMGVDVARFIVEGRPEEL